MSEHIKQEILINAKPEAVFAALTESSRFAALTGAPASIDARPGGLFSRFGGQISGRVIEAEEGKRLVEAWRAARWPEGKYSVAWFELSPQGDATRITFEHSAFPEGEAEHLEPGWHKMYWEPLRNYLA